MSIQKLKRKTDEALRHLVDWSKNYKLQLSADKTQMMFYPNNHMIRTGITIVHDEKFMHRSSKLKYLGVAIDQEMNLLPHIWSIGDKVHPITNNLRGLCRRYWGLSPRISQVDIRERYGKMVLYASEAWWPGGGSWQLWQKPVQIQRPVFLTLTRANRTAPTSALRVLAGLPPLEYFLDLEVKLYKARSGKIFEIQETWYGPE